MSEYLEESEQTFAQRGAARQAVIARPTSGSKSKWIVAIFLGVTVALGIFFALRSQRHKVDSTVAGAEDHSVIVHVGTAYQGDMGVYIDALGTVTPISTVNIYSQVSGQVLAVHYREGQIVHKGDLLLDIDPRPYQAQLQQAEGLLDHDRGVLKQAEIDLARYQEAYTSHAVAKQILDDQEQAVVQAQGAVKFDLGQVQYAEAQLSYCHITAPTSGRVGLRLVDSGNTVFAGSSSALLVITQPTVLSMSLSLVAVFIPILFMGGIPGRLFHEFAVTLAVSIAISMVVSLTLTPMMCAYLLRPETGVTHGRIYRFSELAFGRLLDGYRGSLVWVLKHPVIVLLVFLGTLALNVVLIGRVTKGLFPIQDTGSLLGGIQGPQDASFRAVQSALISVEKVIRSDPAVDVVTGFTGSTSGPGSEDGSNSGFIFVTLKPLAERNLSAAEVLDRMRPQLDAIPGAATLLKPFQDIPSEGKSSNTAYQYELSADNVADLNKWGPMLYQEMRKLPELKDVNIDQQNGGLQTAVSYDRRTAGRLGITPQLIDESLYGAFGQAQISTIYTSLNQYHVVMEAAPQYTQNSLGMNSIYIRPSGGNAVPLNAFVRTTNSTSPLSINHDGLFPAVTVSFNLAPGVSLQQATIAIDKLQQRLAMPPTVRGGFAGTAGGFKKSLIDQIVLVVMALFAVYIVLGVLYESLVHPVTILSTLPPASIGAVLALILCKSELDVISLIGIVLLIGIVKKNAIMMIDFALLAERVEGKNSKDAIFEACLLRFRPIMMTTMAALFGTLPLALGHGTGSELRRPLGIAVAGGLILSQVLTLYTTPVIYLFLDRLRLRFQRCENTNEPIVSRGTI